MECVLPPASQMRTLAFRGKQFARSSRACGKGFVIVFVARLPHAGVMGQVGSRGAPGLEVVRVDGQGPKKPCYSLPDTNAMP